MGSDLVPGLNHLVIQIKDRFMLTRNHLGILSTLEYYQPWNTITTSSSLVKTERSDSDETLHLPHMGSRDFDPEKRSAVRPAAPAGYAI
jgi:hypothetical protein